MKMNMRMVFCNGKTWKEALNKMNFLVNPKPIKKQKIENIRENITRNS